MALHRTMALALLGGNISTAAFALDQTYQAVWGWPDQLGPHQEAEVTAAVAWRDPICKARLQKLGLTMPQRKPPSKAACRTPTGVHPEAHIPPQLRDI